MATIKKIILLALTAIMMAGCSETLETKGGVTFFGYTNIEIDSCEYVRGGNQLAHKGNCRFCKERRQKELEELVIKLKGK